MKIRALAVTALLAGCSQQVPTYSPSSGSIALSNDDALLYAVDTDSDSLFVLDAHTEAVVAQVTVGHGPEKVIVGKDDTVYVSNRMSRSVSVIKRGDWKESAHLDTAVEPSGMAFTSDGKALLVVNATTLSDATVGSLMAFDTLSLQRLFEIPVGTEPRGVAVVGNNALVSLYKVGASGQGGDVVTVDLVAKHVSRASTDVFSKLNENALNGGSNGGFTDGDIPRDPTGTFNQKAFGLPTHFTPHGLESLTVTPDGRQVFATTLLSSSQVLPATSGPDSSATTGPLPPSSGGDSYGGGSCGAGAVASPALLTFDGEGNSQAADTSGCRGQNLDGQPAQVLVSGNPTMPIQGPSAAAVDPTGAFVFVVGRSSNNVAILPTSSSTSDDSNGNITVTKEPTPGPNTAPGGSQQFGGGSINTIVSVGAGPSGVALSHDGKVAWVLNAFDHSVSRLERKDNIVQVVHTAQFTGDVLPTDVVAGRKLFFTAVDSRMTAQGTGIACSSCHLEGREDGHVWNFTDGPRQTPSLAGRMTMSTLPLHWNGEFDGLSSFMAQTVNHRMGGSGVSPEMEAQIGAFIASQPLPDNPNKLPALTDAQQRGALVYQQAGCGTCHLGQSLTDNGFHQVGTLVHDADLNDDPARLVHGGFNTPSLLGIARTAPYLHDGSAATLLDRVNNDEGGGHGNTSGLSADAKADLVEYLKSL